MPKGVLVAHRQVAHYVAALGERLPLPEHPRFALVSALAADLGYTAVLATLSRGGRLSMVPKTVVTEPLELAEWFAREQIDSLKIVPSHLRALMSASPDPAAPLPRRLLVLGGEACPTELVGRIRELAPDCAVVNHYGPTETTIGVCTLRLDDRPLDPRWRSAPIGRPLGSSTVHVLDRYLRPVPAWLPGELYIGGPGVALGYRARPAATAERFLPAPGGGRWYRTGDLVRRLPDGNLEFLGRSDEQVKISGYRVEPGEVAAVLGGHPAVGECVVTATEGPNRRLVAHVVATDPTLDPVALREYAAQQLPDHLVPAGFVLLARLPRTANGKIDRAALPTWDGGVRTGRAAVPPRNGAEFRLLRIWGELLEVDGIGVTDNFVDVGGNSLLAVRLIAEIHRQLGVRLPVATVFSARTVAAMALRLEDRRPPAGGCLVPIRPDGSKPPLFCLHAGGGSVLGYLDLVRSLDPDQPIYGLESVGLDGQEPPLTRLDQMAERYVAQIRAVRAQGPYAIAGWCLGSMLAYEVTRRLRAAGDEIAILLLIDSAAPNPLALEEVSSGRSQDPYRASLLEAGLVHRFVSHYQIPVDPESLEAGTESDRVELLLRSMRAPHLVHPEADATQLESMLRVYRSNVSALREYVRGFVPAGRTDYPVLLVRAEDARDDSGTEETLGWATLIGDRLQTEWLPGDHHAILRAPIATHLAELIQKSIDAAAERFS